MNKRLLATLGIAIALGWASPAARAGEGECAGAGCTNVCPLAVQANKRRSFGEEAVVASTKMRQEQVRVVLKNLAVL
jgi:hypothetical protein